MDNIYYDDYIKIGTTIRKLRMQAGISQTKLAEGICDRTAIIHLEKGRSKQPSIYLLNQLCRRLSITLDDFFLIAYGGNINQLWLKKNEIDSLMKIREYEKAYIMAKKYFVEAVHPVDVQYLGLVEANYYYYTLEDYQKAKDLYKKALSITCVNIDDEVYTLNEMRLINGLIYCNWRIDNKLSTEETINYIRILNNSIYNYPMDKDYNIIIPLMISTIHFYSTLRLYDDTVIIINNAIELANKHCCYSYLGNLWMMLGNIYEIQMDKKKSKEYYDKAKVFFNLFNEDKLSEVLFDHQVQLYENLNY